MRGIPLLRPPADLGSGIRPRPGCTGCRVGTRSRRARTSNTIPPRSRASRHRQWGIPRARRIPIGRGVAAGWGRTSAWARRSRCRRPLPRLGRTPRPGPAGSWSRMGRSGPASREHGTPRTPANSGSRDGPTTRLRGKAFARHRRGRGVRASRGAEHAASSASLMTRRERDLTGGGGKAVPYTSVSHAYSDGDRGVSATGEGQGPGSDSVSSRDGDRDRGRDGEAAAAVTGCCCGRGQNQPLGFRFRAAQADAAPITSPRCHSPFSVSVSVRHRSGWTDYCGGGSHRYGRRPTGPQKLDGE
jgi:hypothetical protein